MGRVTRATMIDEIQWINDSDSIILAGWYIHFNDMCAYAPTIALKRVELINKYVDSDYIAAYPSDCRTVFDDIFKRHIAKALFETDPRLENLLQEAYQSYLLEKSMKGIP